MSTTPPASRTSPRPAIPAASGYTKSAFVPASRCAVTPGEPSAFISTADQWPERTDQVTCWVPVPQTDLDQNPCPVGGAIVTSPPRWR
jgi:hypothetical protein